MSDYLVDVGKGVEVFFNRTGHCAEDFEPA